MIKYICICLLICNSFCWAGLDYDGVDDSVDCPQMTVLEGAAEVSITGWGKHNETTGAGWLYHKIDSIPGDSWQCFWDNNDMRTRLDAGGGNVVFAGPDKASFAYDSWWSYAFTYDGTTARVYFNGVEVANGALSGTVDLTGTSTIFRIANNTAGEHYNGESKEFTIWTKGLTVEEVELFHSAGISGITHQIQPLSRVAYWPLDELPEGGNMAGVVFNDRSGNGNHGLGIDTNTSGGQGRAEEQLSR